MEFILKLKGFLSTKILGTPELDDKWMTTGLLKLDQKLHAFSINYSFHSVVFVVRPSLQNELLYCIWKGIINFSMLNFYRRCLCVIYLLSICLVLFTVLIYSDMKTGGTHNDQGLYNY